MDIAYAVGRQGLISCTTAIRSCLTSKLSLSQRHFHPYDDASFASSRVSESLFSWVSLRDIKIDPLHLCLRIVDNVIFGRLLNWSNSDQLEVLARAIRTALHTDSTKIIETKNGNLKLARVPFRDMLRLLHRIDVTGLYPEGDKHLSFLRELFPLAASLLENVHGDGVEMSAWVRDPKGSTAIRRRIANFVRCLFDDDQGSIFLKNQVTPYLHILQRHLLDVLESGDVDPWCLLAESTEYENYQESNDFHHHTMKGGGRGAREPVHEMLCHRLFLLCVQTLFDEFNCPRDFVELTE